MIIGLLTAYAIPVIALFIFAVWNNRRKPYKITFIDLGVFLVLSVCWPLTLTIVAWRPRP